METNSFVASGNSPTVAVHRTFDDQAETKGEPIYFVADAEGVTQLSAVKFDKYSAKLEPGSTVRVTNASSLGSVIHTLQKAGHNVVTAHWHATGIAKGLGPEDIARAFYALSADVFKAVTVRDDIGLLRAQIAAHYAVVKNRVASTLKLSAIARGLGLADAAELPLWLQAGHNEQDEDEKLLEKPIVKAINLTAASIPECVILNEILGVSGKSWLTSAGVIAYIADPARFGSVSALWHYAGFHVANGKAPKRAKGGSVDWNPKLRTVLWKWCDSTIKNMDSKWRPAYDEYRLAELSVHEAKCSACAGQKSATEAQRLKKAQVISSHSGARARRRVIKDVLRMFWVRMQKPKGEAYATTA